MPDETVIFDRAADYYDATRGFPPGEEVHAARLMARAGSLGAHSHILEVGIGTGRIALPLAAETSARLTGVDLSVPMMARLQAKDAADKIALAQGDVRALPLAAGMFDAAVAVHVFHLVPETPKVLAELARVLRPSGVLLNGWTDFDTQMDVWKVFREAVGAPAEPVGVRDFSRPRFLLDAGWRPVAQPLAHTFTYTQTPGDLVERHAQRMYSSTWELDDDALERGVNALREALTRTFGDLDTPVTRQARFRVQAFRPPVAKA